MTKKIFVTATNTNVGKTHVTCLLMEEAARRGFRPAAFKPIETGVEDDNPLDGSLLLETMQKLNPATHSLTTDEIVPYRFELPAAPYIAKGDTDISLEVIEKQIGNIESFCDILFIEGAGGLMVPIEKELFMIDLPNRLGAHTLLVSPSRLGSINDTLLSMEALTSRGIDFTLAINLYEERESFAHVTQPFYRETQMAYHLLPQGIERLFEHLINR
ncbi:dethiobiotin synthase [Hydrogenimonas sp.]|uniref:dethiobiotin synthase n=1 Tax=Hydrogenimonas sp. TaxID=2231112 RepID=UPI00260300A5|nr:dethiobiotin synthase [Hydrogenimonas sp.]